MHLFAGRQNFSLTSAMTSMLALGLTLEQVVPMVTSNCAAMLGMQDEIGTLKPGVEADVSVLADETRPLRAAGQRGHAGRGRAFHPAGLLPARRQALRCRRRDPAPAAAGRRRMTAEPGGLGVGASLRRKEDARFLHGRGRFVGDITRPGMLEVAFLRSPVAHARLQRRHQARRRRRSTSSRSTISPGIGTIRANSALPGFRVSEQPALAKDKVRHVGEAIAACVADSRAAAEDLAAACELDYEALPAVLDMLHRVPARRAAGPRRLVDERLPRDAARRRRVGSRCHRRGEGDAHLAHVAPVDGAARGPGRAGRVGSAARAADRHDLDPDAARHQDRPGRLPRPRRGPGADRLARCRRRLRLQGHPAAGGDRLRAASRSGSAGRCAGSRIASSS